MGTENRRRLCLYCETWASGGIESFLFNVLTHTDLTGLDVELVAAQVKDSVFTRPLEALGVHFVELSGDPHRVSENHRRFSRLLERRRYDAVHLNLFQGLSLAYARLAAQAGVPIRIAHSHNADLRQSLTRSLKLALHRWGCRRYGGYATHRWACSEPAARFLFGAQSWQFIPNGIDTQRFRFDPSARQRVRRELELANAFVVGHVGRLCRQKNQGFLLEAFGAFHRQRPDSALLLVGEGEDRAALEGRARALGLEDAVLFYGPTDRVEELYWAMDCLVMPSLFEGLPVTAVEAQAAGLPCLFSQTIARSCALTPDAAFLPLEAGAAHWGAAIAGLQPVRDHTAAAQDVAAAGFDVTAVAQKVQKVWMG